MARPSRVVALFALWVLTGCRGASVEEVAPPTPAAEASPSAPEIQAPATAAAADTEREEPAIHVHPGDTLQAALDRAADEGIKQVIVHAGTYRPERPQQALIWFNRKHDGLVVRARGDVTLTAANESVADKSARSYPAIVNHVVYFGDGVGPATTLAGFRITGANDFVTTKPDPEIEPAAGSAERLKKTTFFYTDGGAIKIFGRSYPTLEHLTIEDNYASPCGAGISIEHRGYIEQAVTIRSCVFRNNRVPLTGAALDLLDHEFGSRAVVENCLFVANLSNCSMDNRSLRLGTWRARDGHGAVTVFAFSHGVFRNCTFVGNRNGVDDESAKSSYDKCIFWQNNASGGWPKGDRYEAAIEKASVTNCYLGAAAPGGGGKVDPRQNVLEAPDPEFDEHYNPKNTLYRTQNIGYRASEELRFRSGEAKQSTARTQHEPIAIHVRGREFNWYWDYGVVEGRRVTARRHLVVPAHAKVELRIDSDDYLYSLKLPQQSVNQIAVPGLTHHSSFQAPQPGVYPLVGDQFCGYTHPNLIGKLIVYAPAAYEAWHKQQLSQP